MTHFHYKLGVVNILGITHRGRGVYRMESFNQVLGMLIGRRGLREVMFCDHEGGVYVSYRSLTMVGQETIYLYQLHTSRGDVIVPVHDADGDGWVEYGWRNRQGRLCTPERHIVRGRRVWSSDGEYDFGGPEWLTQYLLEHHFLPPEW